MVQLSHPYMTTGKTIALTMWTFVGRVMSLLLSMLFRFLLAFLPRSRHLLLSWLQSLSTMILEPKKIKSVTTSNTLATWCKELTHWKTRWCWERLKAGGEGDNRRWDGWKASSVQWTWVWVSSGRWWKTGKPDVLQSMESKRGGHVWVNKNDKCVTGSLCCAVGGNTAL